MGAFTNKLKKSKGSAGEADAPAAVAAVVSYHGQVLETGSDDESGNAEDWFEGKLKFRKHIDVSGGRWVSKFISFVFDGVVLFVCLYSQDAFRTGGDGRAIDDYQTIDSRKR